MSNILELEGAVLKGEAGIIDYICACFEGAECGAELMEAQYWQTVKDARKNGKKLMLFAGPVPVELLYTADCVPLNADMLPLAICRSEALAARFINHVETKVSPNLCTGSKLILGALRLGGLEVDGFIRAPISCPSFKSAYDDARLFLGVPYFEFDTPARFTERNLEFMVQFMSRAVDFLEGITGVRPDTKDLWKLMETSNRARKLLDGSAQLRRTKPCPMSSHMVETGRLMTVFAPTDKMAELLEIEISECERLTKSGFSPCGEEKHRVFFLQSPMWCGKELRQWLEKEYGSVTVLDGMGYEPGFKYEIASGTQECYTQLARGLFSPSMLHGGTQSAPVLIERCVRAMEEYSPDVLLFLGDRWCRQAWAVSKILADALLERFGFAAFMTDADSYDARYKDEKQLKALISEYMDAVICGK